jgi:hypothetical protein
VVTEHPGVVGAQLPGPPGDRLDVRDHDGEVVVARRVHVALEEVDLRVADPEPLHGKAVGIGSAPNSSV